MRNASKDQIPRDHFLVVDQWSTGLDSLQTLERGVSLKNESKGERILEDDIKENRSLHSFCEHSCSGKIFFYTLFLVCLVEETMI